MWGCLLHSTRELKQTVMETFDCQHRMYRHPEWLSPIYGASSSRGGKGRKEEKREGRGGVGGK